MIYSINWSNRMIVRCEGTSTFDVASFGNTPEAEDAAREVVRSMNTRILPAHHAAQCFLFEQALYGRERRGGTTLHRLSDLRRLWRFYEARAKADTERRLARKGA